MATAKGIKIPVSLELSNLQSSISTLQNALKDVDPGSSLYKSIERGIDKAKKELNALEVQSKKSFGSQAEINAFEKSFNKTSQGIQEMANSLSKVSFKDLKGVFSEADIAPIKEAGNKIKELQNQIANIKTDKMKELANSSKEFSEQLNKFGGTTFDEKVKNIEARIKKLNNDISETEIKIATSKQTRDTAKAQLEPYLNDFNKAKYKDSLGRFKGGVNSGRKKLREDLLAVGFKEEEINNIIQTFTSDIIKAKEDITKGIAKRLNEKQTIYDKANIAYEKNVTELKTQTEQRNAAQGIRETLSNIEDSPELNSQIESLNAKINEQAQLIQKLQTELAAMSNAAQTGAKAEKEVGDNAEEASDKINVAREQMARFASSAELLSKIKFAIKNWFGFNEVINLTKNSVRKMVQSIVELDDVMTQISIVTNMSQDDLWKQMDSYSRMAEQYAVSIKGTYEVSQLFYQQGLQSNQVMKLTEETLKMAKIANLDYAKATDYMTVA